MKPDQLKAYHALAKRAWETWAPGNGRDVTDRKAYDAWRHAEVETVTGKTSARDLNTTDDFERIMAHWEAICGDSIHWNLKAATAAFRRIRHVVQAANKDQQLTIPESYVLAIAKQAGAARESLSELTHQGEVTVIRALKIQVLRLLSNGSADPLQETHVGTAKKTKPLQSQRAEAPKRQNHPHSGHPA